MRGYTTTHQTHIGEACCFIPSLYHSIYTNSNGLALGIMDPLTVIGLVANIVQFVELGCKVLASAKELRHSTSGLTADDQRTSKMMTEMHRLSTNLGSSGKEASNADEKAIFELAFQCRDLADQILGLMGKVSIKGRGSRIGAIRSAFSKMWCAKEKQELETKLSICRSQLHLHLDYASR